MFCFLWMKNFLKILSKNAKVFSKKLRSYRKEGSLPRLIVREILMFAVFRFYKANFLSGQKVPNIFFIFLSKCSKWIKQKVTLKIFPLIHLINWIPYSRTLMIQTAISLTKQIMTQSFSNVNEINTFLNDLTQQENLSPLHLNIRSLRSNQMTFVPY